MTMARISSATLAVTVVLVTLASLMSLKFVPRAKGYQMQKFLTGTFIRGACQINGKYPLDKFSTPSSLARRYALGHTWRDRCNSCKCIPKGAMCTGPGYSCKNWYDFTQEPWCIQWSDDGCCCEEMGCTLDGKSYGLGEQMPYGRGNPCLTCTCQLGWKLEHCLQEKCGVAEVQCRDRTVTYEGCCPKYKCPHGDSCENIPDPYPNTPNNELLNFFQYLRPIRLGRTRTYNVGNGAIYECKCETLRYLRTANCTLREPRG